MVKRCIIVAASILMLLPAHYSSAQHHEPYLGWMSAAERLANHRVDTTDHQKIRQISDSLQHPLHNYAMLFLAQHGYADIIPKLKSSFFEFMSTGNWYGNLYYLASLYAFRDADTYQYARSLLDTMVANYGTERGHFLSSEMFVQVIEVLIDYGDYSRYDFFKSLFDYQPRPMSSKLWVFGAFSQSPALRSTALNDLKPFLKDSDPDYRQFAVTTLLWFKDYEERKSLLQQVALTDSSAEIRYWAISYLLDYPDIPTAIQAFEELAKKFQHETYTVSAIHGLADLNTPYALAALVRIGNALPPGYFKDRAKISLEVYSPPSPRKPISTMVLIDSLVAFVAQVSGLGWLADANFVSELDADLQFARSHLLSGDSLNCARQVKAFQQKIDEEYKDSLDNDNRTVTVEGWSFLYYNAQYILDRLPQIPPSPVITSLTPSSASAGSGSFTLSVNGKAFVSASVVHWNTSPRATSFIADSLLQAVILASDIAAAGTASVAVVNPGNDTSNTVSFAITAPPPGLIVKLVNSRGARLTDGSLQYYEGSWKDAVNNNDGTFTVITSLHTVSLRMTYAYASQTKSNVTVGPDTVVFQTVNARVQLRNSQGAQMDTGTVQYYAGAWRSFGTTTSGTASKELLPANYSFRMTYGFASKDKQQDIGTNPIVVFQTVNAVVQLQNSQGSLIDQGTVQYYSGAWRDFGATSNGIATKELLPNNYSFRMTYAFASKDKQQDIGTNPIVVFQTVNAVVQLQNSQGNLIDQGTVQYYAGAWRAFGSTSNGTVSKELLPGNYSFRMTHEFISLDKAQDISTNTTVSYSTVSCTVRVRNSQKQPVDNAQASYYSGAWRQIGATVNGEVTKELLPVNLTFRINYGGTQQDKVQNLATNSVVEFVVQ